MSRDVTEKPDYHTLSVLVQDQPGILAKVVGLFSRRGFNISSLAVGPTENEGFSRITIVVKANVHSIDQVVKQLHKLVFTLKVMELRPDNSTERAFVLIKVSTTPESRASILQIVDIFRTRIVDVDDESVTIEATGSRDKLDALTKMIEPYGIRELVQSGVIALGRGAETITERRPYQERKLRDLSVS